MASSLRPAGGSIFSTAEEMDSMTDALCGFLKLPWSTNSIPGSVVEEVLAQFREAETLRTYDFVDVIDRKNGLGWQVKSTLSETPITWQRAKIPNKLELIEASMSNLQVDLQNLGNTILEYNNDHVEASMNRYGLHSIGYARVVITKAQIRYFERELVNSESRRLWDPDDFTWQWSASKNAVKKEQLPALHGYHKATGEKWFAWHGRGENQLHFTGERHWWPSGDESVDHQVVVDLPSSDARIPFGRFVELLAKYGDEDTL